jgi:hypothetical protein
MLTLPGDVAASNDLSECGFLHLPFSYGVKINQENRIGSCRDPSRYGRQIAEQ